MTSATKRIDSGKGRKSEKQELRELVSRWIGDGTVAVKWECPVCGGPHSRDDHDFVAALSPEDACEALERRAGQLR